VEVICQIENRETVARSRVSRAAIKAVSQPVNRTIAKKKRAVPVPLAGLKTRPAVRANRARQSGDTETNNPNL
jgi:hypothetical protein